jgi:glucokinase
MPRDTAPTDRHLLAADIGGTNSRFGHFTLSPSGDLALVSSVWLPTGSADSFVELLGRLPESGFTLPLARAEAAVFAVPGAVVGRTVTFANIDWALDLDEVSATFGLARTACVNDFLAQAHGCRLLGGDADAVLPGAMDPARVQAVIGAGTGLGHAALAPLEPRAGGGYKVLPSEKGHASASFFGDEENAFAAYLCRQTGEAYVRGDTVLSGSGLAHLHRFVTGEDLTPARSARR